MIKKEKLYIVLNKLLYILVFSNVKTLEEFYQRSYVIF